MSDNVIITPTHQIVFNGGDPLPGCPTSYSDANAWADKANDGKDEYYEPIWKFDCGFKLDFDGPLICVSSRFYPPKSHYGPKWHGKVCIQLGDAKIVEKSFECESLDDLKDAVELYLAVVMDKLKDAVSKLDLR